MGVKQAVQKAPSSTSPLCFHASEYEWRTFSFFSTLLINQPTSQQRPFKGLKPQAIKFLRLMLCCLSLRESFFKPATCKTKQIKKKPHNSIILHVYSTFCPKGFQSTLWTRQSEVLPPVQQDPAAC